MKIENREVEYTVANKSTTVLILVLLTEIQFKIPWRVTKPDRLYLKMYLNLTRKKTSA